MIEEPTDMVFAAVKVIEDLHEAIVLYWAAVIISDKVLVPGSVCQEKAHEKQNCD